MEIGPRLFRFLFNFYPPFLFSRARVKYIAPDWKEIVVVLPKSLLTRNYVGTTFGGSLYSATDPFFMLMLIKILGLKDYVVWDQSAEITYLRPARSKITYRFEITDQDLSQIKEELKTKPVVIPQFRVQGVGQDQEVCVEVTKKIYIRKKKITGRAESDRPRSP